MLSAGGSRQQLIERYDQFVKKTLAQEGMSSPSEAEEEVEQKASDNPALIMTDESTGNRYMRLVDQKGMGRKREMAWLVNDIHAEFKAWGHPGGGDNRLILKSGGEPAIVALREAVAKIHGGRVTPEQPPKGEHQ